MHEPPRHKNYRDNAAGLESSKFAREANRFDAMAAGVVKSKINPRQPRIGYNMRNQTSATRESNFMYNIRDTERFEALPIEVTEKKYKEEKREKELKRIEIKREWRNGIESRRWDLHDAKRTKEKEVNQRQAANYKSGVSSVNFDPITHQYLDTNGGYELQIQDAQAKHRLAIRTAKIYSKTNTFDPMRCVDVPRFGHLDSPGKDKAAGLRTVMVSKAKHLQDFEVSKKVVAPTEPHTARLLFHQIENGANETKSLTGKDPIVNEALLSWKFHY